MAASDFTLDSVQDFMLSHGGRVKNHELVTHFKAYLNDPERKEKIRLDVSSESSVIHMKNQALFSSKDKVEMRDKFKDFVNTLATIKVDEQNDKILVLKRKYRSESLGDSTPDMSRASSEPPGVNSGSANDRPDGIASSRLKSDGNLSTFDERLSASVSSSISLGSAVSSSSLSSATVDTAEEDNNMSVVSVKERAKHLNRIESESELMQQTSASSLGAVRKNIKESKKAKDKDDDDSSTGSGYVTLDPQEKEWLVVSSSADYHAMHQLLSKQPELARVKDFTSTAIHWAAKHGRTEVIKMLVNKPGVSVNQKTGYTPLHLAAIHGHEDVIELLVQTFKADPNIRDYSGKKPKQYLKNSASSRAQRFMYHQSRSWSIPAEQNQSEIVEKSELLVSSRLSSKGRDSSNSEGGFTRNSSGRRSNRARAITSLIQASSAGLQQAIMRRSSWGSQEDVNKTTPKSTPTSSPRHSAESSPDLRRRKGSFSKDREMMPPPSAPSRKSRKPYSISKESLMTEDRRQSAGRQVPRSESEPNLGEAIQPSATTFI